MFCYLLIQTGLNDIFKHNYLEPFYSAYPQNGETAFLYHVGIKCSGLSSRCGRVELASPDHVHIFRRSLIRCRLSPDLREFHRNVVSQD